MGGNEVGRANKTKLVHERTSQLGDLGPCQVASNWSAFQKMPAIFLFVVGPAYLSSSGLPYAAASIFNSTID